MEDLTNKNGARVTEIVTDIYGSLKKWDELVAEGIPIIRRIMEEKLSSDPAGNTGNLNELCKQLEHIYKNMEIIVDVVKSSWNQICSLRSLAEFQGDKDVPVMMNWTVKDFADNIEIVNKAYSKELQVKQYVLEDMAHCTNRDDLIFYLTCWEHEPYVNVEMKQFTLQSIYLVAGLVLN